MPEEDEVGLVLDSIERLDEGLEAAHGSEFDSLPPYGCLGYWFSVKPAKRESVYTRAFDLARYYTFFIDGEYYGVAGYPKESDVADSIAGRKRYLLFKLPNAQAAATWLRANFYIDTSLQKLDRVTLEHTMKEIRGETGVYSWGELVVKQTGEV